MIGVWVPSFGESKGRNRFPRSGFDRRVLGRNAAEIGAFTGVRMANPEAVGNPP